MKKYDSKMSFFLLIILFLGIFGLADSSGAADRYVRAGATGSNNGSDWTNAYTSLPASLVRGDTYYVSDGTYGGHTFDDSVSGTSVITIKKATALDHGTDTGWDVSYGDWQALFTEMFTFNTSYYVIDGQTGGGPGSWESGYGFRIKRSGTGAIKAVTVSANYVTLAHMDIENNGMDIDGSSDTIYTLGNNNLTISYCWLHNTNRTNFLISGSMNNFVLEYSLVSDRHNRDGIHGEHMSINNTGTNRNNIIRYSVFRDAGGANTGVIVIKDSVQSGWKIYGNLFYNTSGFNAMSTNGIITDSTGDTSTDMKIYNNTFLPHPSINGDAAVVSWDVSTGNTFVNNIVFGGAGLVGVSTRGYNVWDNQSRASGEAHGQYISSQASLFTNPAAYDYTLKSATNGGDSTVGSEYALDGVGNIRGADGNWDRGAYEYVGPVRPAPPSGITIE